MGLPQRDLEFHPSGDYRHWPEVARHELIDERGCRGAPDWIIEVLSPSTAGHDHIRTRAVYARAGARAYWRVPPVDHIVSVYRLVDGIYGKPEVHDLVGATASVLLPGGRVDWERVLREA